MAGSEGDPEDPFRRRVDAAASFVGSNHNMWQRTKANGLPRWAQWFVIVAMILGVAGAVGVYAATRSLLAAAVIPGFCWLVASFVLYMVDLDRRARE
jgi:hypothetical protein